MPHDRSFWRNLAIIGVVHLIVLAGVLRWSASATKPAATDVVWMDAGAAPITAESPEPIAENTAEPTPTPEPEPEVTPMQDPLTMRTPPPSDDESATPTPTATPKPTPKATPKPTPRATPKKSATPKPKPAKSKKDDAPKTKKVSVKVEPTQTTTEGNNSAGTRGGSQNSGAANAAQFSWYGNMLHDRFFGAWVQPKTAEATGSKMSTLVQLRIEKDGRVSSFNIVRSSGNVVVDESVAAVAKRVTRVDPLPAGLNASGHYDVKINFELNVE